MLTVSMYFLPYSTDTPKAFQLFQYQITNLTSCFESSDLFIYYFKTAN